MGTAKDSLKSVFAFMVVVLVIVVVGAVLLSVTEQVKTATPLQQGTSEYNISTSIGQGAMTAFALVGAVLMIILVGVILEALGIDLRRMLGDVGI